MLRVHTSLGVEDLAATSAFYEQLFQSKPVKTKADYVKFEPEDFALNISFIALEAGKDIDAKRHHLGIQFPSQERLDQAFERLRAAGLIQGERESSVCCYADQDKFHVVDPDGYKWELYFLLSDTEMKTDPASKCCAPAPDMAACCG